jgi:hypothetical protein
MRRAFGMTSQFIPPPSWSAPRPNAPRIRHDISVHSAAVMVGASAECAAHSA